mgnify:CR=1 FL=1
MTNHLYVIAGHGAGDPGACGNGFQEAERVRVLAQRIKDFGGDAVTLHPFHDNAYASNAISTMTAPKEWQIVELHMDSGPASAHGGHVIYHGDYKPDPYDVALANGVANLFPGRASKLVGRKDLANVKRAARRGYGYRLVENGFISNAGDVATFNSRIDDLAKIYLAAFCIDAGEAPAAPSPAPSAPAQGGALEVDGYWGPATVTACQAALGTVQDGVVSGQDSRDMAAIGGVPSSAWQVGRGSSQMVRAIQSKVGANADGYFGPNTCKALQRYLGTEADGVISKPSQMVKEMQRRLNSGTF